MFDRYTEPARRSLFFARYEISVIGGTAIETEHLLLGLLKEQDPLVSTLLATANATDDGLRQRIYARVAAAGTPPPQSIEIPFSTDAKHVLEYTLEEVERLLHPQIGPEHILLGLLSLERGLAWEVLSESGLTLPSVRDALVMHVSAPTLPPPEVLNMLVGIVPYDGERARRDGTMYWLTALEGSRPGRRPVTDDSAAGVFSGSSLVEFSTAANRPPDGHIHAIGPLSLHAATLPQFALVLEAFLDGPVILDEDVAVTERFDIELHGQYDNADALIVALRDQLGLVLTRSDA